MKTTIEIDLEIWADTILPLVRPILENKQKDIYNQLAKIRLIIDAVESGEIDTMPLPQRILYSKFSEELIGKPIPFKTNFLR